MAYFSINVYILGSFNIIFLRNVIEKYTAALSYKKMNVQHTTAFAFYFKDQCTTFSMLYQEW